jgi:GWxTD domain-containing protein
VLLVFSFLFGVPTHAQKVGSPLESAYKKWLDEDVRWIISDQERADFKKLADDKERDRFVVEFWERRNPTPGGSRNIVKEEYYRRLAYVNQHFSEDVPGWRWSYIEGLGCDVVIEFEGSDGRGEYHLTARHGEFRPRWKSSPDCLIEQILFP